MSVLTWALLLPSARILNYKHGASFNNGTTNHLATQQFTVINNTLTTGVVGGLKFGYFFKSIPYLGLEGETNVSPNRVNSPNQERQSGGAGKQPGGYAQLKIGLTGPSALHIVGRYGFFKDSEVPFGRLQPYVGIGPGVVVHV